MPTPAVIDTHAHCGIMDRNPPHAIEDYARDLVDTDIQGAAFFSPVAEIYDRYDPFLRIARSGGPGGGIAMRTCSP